MQSALVFIERMRERWGILVALIPNLGVPILPEQSGRCTAVGC